MAGNCPVFTLGPQKNFLCTMAEPDSSYSHLEHHICWDVHGDDKIEPTIRVACMHSGGATTSAFILESDFVESDFVIYKVRSRHIPQIKAKTISQMKAKTISQRSKTKVLSFWKNIRKKPKVFQPTLEVRRLRNAPKTCDTRPANALHWSMKQVCLRPFDSAPLWITRLVCLF
jgi:hypothetical protein